jgi:hypothetical protein
VVIDKLNALCTVLSDEALNMYALATSLGTVTAEYKYMLKVNPADEEFQAVNVARRVDSEEVAHVDLRLSESLPLRVLVNAFGEYEELPPMPNEPDYVVFYVERDEMPYRIALIAAVKEGEAHDLTLRRNTN